MAEPTFRPMAVERLRALRRMKLIAAALLVAAAAIYVGCRLGTDGHGFWGYLQAAAEASMVGGLADWFAVTALFRHPLNLPIPHTAIIPSKKDQIGAGLASFVNDYFLTTDIVGERVAAARVPQRVGEWLADPAHASQVAGELSRAVGGTASVLRDNELRDAVASFADKRLRELDAAPVVARVIDGVCDSGQHQAVLTATLRGLLNFLDENRGSLRRRLSDESPEWVPDWVDDRVFAKGFTSLKSFLTDIADSPDHDLRRSYDMQLRRLAERLRTDSYQARAVERMKLQLLDDPRVRASLTSLWARVKQSLLEGAQAPDSELRQAVERLTIRIGEVLRDDTATRTKIDEALQRLSAHVVTHYGEDLAAVITTTVERWDTEETSRRLELQVGRDLQFIRINGTVVGSLAGLAIYTLTQVL